MPFQNSVKFLGLHFDNRLNWKTQINNLLVRCHKKNHCPKIHIRYFMGNRQKIIINGVQVLNSFSLRLWLTGVWVCVRRNTEEAGCMSANVSWGPTVYMHRALGG